MAEVSRLGKSGTLWKVEKSLKIPDIGSDEAADTSTYHPIWFRVYCPGGTEAQ